MSARASKCERRTEELLRLIVTALRAARTAASAVVAAIFCSSYPQGWRSERASSANRSASSTFPMSASVAASTAW